MEKIIQLLNEYQEQKSSEIRFKRIDDSDFFVCGDDVGLGYETILSKKFGFIKRLVDNNKIDRIKIVKLWKCGLDYSPYETVLMLLSISDSPIYDLISYLK